jgi:hypothetical protein
MSTLPIQNAAHWTAAGCGRLLEATPPVRSSAGLPVWNEVCKRAYERYPRLDPLSKIVGVLAEWILENIEISPDLGMILSTHYGCVEADLAFYRSAAQTPELASPQLFPYTLPSTGLAEVAIRHKLIGPARVLLHEPDVAEALRQAADWLETKTVSQCLVMHADAWLEDGARFLQQPACVEGWAFLLGNNYWVSTLRIPASSKTVKPDKLFAQLQTQRVESVRENEK